ncbi:MAG TPA: glycosyltransferase family 39 protein [Caulobacteraceae bacterium]|nr:glycosyltransferase family 39 protein [Caulobacteraceae bacterium]
MSPPPSPSGEAIKARSAARGLILLLVGLAVLRVAAAALIPLTEDEAYYRLWSQRLALGYYDHPPMIAWWIRAGVTLAGDDALGVRLLPALANLAATVLVFDLGRTLSGPRLGLSGALLYNCTLTVGAAAALAVPDAPAGLFWTAALWALAKAARDDRPRWWLAAGVMAGLACLSKYSALFLAPGVALWLAATPDGRRRLAQPWPWIAAAVALGLFGANVAWNAQHHWQTFDKQFGRVAASRLNPRYLAELLAGQFVLLNPVVAILAMVGAGQAWRARAAAPVAWLMLAAIGPFLAYLLIHSLHDRVQAHWPVPLYSAAAILAAWACEAGGWRVHLARWAPVGLALSVLALAHAAAPATDLGQGDPARQLRGWPAFARAVDEERRASGAAWIGTQSYGVLAQIEAADPALPALQIDERARYAALPQTVRPAPGQSGLIVDLRRRVDPAKLSACFSGVKPLGDIDRDGGVGADQRYAAVLVWAPKVDLLGAGCAN